MELHQLQCFIEVIEKGGFRRATASLDMTQPALSYQIKQLEEELGVTLFHRRAGGIAPTAAGRVFLDHARAVIAAVREAHRAVHEIAEITATSELRIGCLPCIGTYFLPHVLWEMQTRYASLRPKLCYGDSDGLLESLLAGKLEVALVADPPPDGRVRHESVLQDRISLVSGRGHPFYGRGTVEARELNDAQLVLLSPRSSTGALIRRYLERLGIAVNPVLSSDDPETLKMMVEEGMGVTFLPDMVTSEDIGRGEGPDLLARSAIDPPLQRHVIVATRSDVENTPGLAAFVEAVRRKGRQLSARQDRSPPAAAGN